MNFEAPNTNFGTSKMNFGTPKSRFEASDSTADEPMPASGGPIVRSAALQARTGRSAMTVRDSSAGRPAYDHGRADGWAVEPGSAPPVGRTVRPD